MTSTLLIIQIILAIAITITVLLQKSSGMGLGGYSGSNESLFGAKGPAGFLTKLTFTLAIIFIINTLALGYLYNQAKKGSIVEEMKKEKVIPAVPTTPKIDTKKAPTAPKETK